MTYIAIPGSTVDMYSGSILAELAGTTQTTDGTVSGKKLCTKFELIFELNFFKNFYFIANGMPFTIEVIQAVASMASADGFSLIYTQTSCSLSP